MSAKKICLREFRIYMYVVFLKIPLFTMFFHILYIDEMNLWDIFLKKLI